MERIKRAVSLILCFVMVFGLLPMHAFAATADDSLTAALTEARAYINGITVNNAANDPSTVVSKFETHFTWDNEKRETNGKSYLYDWSYYNGVVFEGIEYLYEVTGEQQYKDYVVEYMSSLITAAGDWATCSNNSGKTCAGYVNYHGADCYKTASLLLDVYDMTGDQRYLDMAESLYLDLNEADNSNVVMLDEAGNNYRHTWASNPTPDLWLDGLYMILPFRAEYAKHAGKQEELNQIVSRLQWVSDNMDNGEGLFYHAADNASSNSGTFWLRSIGWYAAAVADVMDSMEGSNLETMKTQLIKLVEGMMPYQRESGLWSNAVTGTVDNDANREETSGTALLAYAILKAVNNGWIEEAYADVAIKAFKGICENKLEGTELKDICFIGTPGSANAKFYNNEGKGVGPFIMLTAEVQEYVNNLPTESEPTEPEEDEVVLKDIRVKYNRQALLGEELVLQVSAVYSDGTTKALAEGEYTVLGYDPNKTGTQGVIVSYGGLFRGFNVIINADCGVSVLADGMNSLTVTDVTEDETVVNALANTEHDGYVAYDITPDTYNTADNDAVVAVPVPEEWNVGELVVYYINESGEIADSIATEHANGKAVFETDHFTTYALVNGATPAAETGSVTGTGHLVGGKVYTLDTDGVSTNKNYLIVSGNSGDVSALTNNGSSTPGSTSVRVSGNTITVDDDSNIAWQFSGTTSGTVGNNGLYVYPNNGSLSLREDDNNMTISNQGSGQYRIYRTDSSNRKYYLRYNSEWTGTRVNSYSTTSYSVYLYELTSSSEGQLVTFTVTPGSGSLNVEDVLKLNPTVQVGSNPASNYTITWGTGNNSVATVANDGTVLAVGAGSTNITATLTSANNTDLVDDIVLTIPVTVTAVTLTGISVSNTEGITTCVHKDADFTNVTVKAIYSDGSQVELTEGVTFTYEKAVGEQTVTVTYEGKTATFPITVEDPEITGKTLSGPTIFSFGKGDRAVFSGLAVQYTYACGCTEENPSGLTVSGYDVNVPGTYENCPVMLDGEQLGTVTVIINEYTPVVGEGNLVGSYVYTLDTNGIDAGEKYLIVNTGSNGTGYALTNNGTNSGTRTQVTISGSQITVADDTTIAWIFSGASSGTVKNGSYYVSLSSSSSTLSTSSRTLTFTNRNNGAYYVYYDNTSWFGTDYYLRYSNNSWGRTDSGTNVYLYRQTDATQGAPVTFAIDRDSVTLKPGDSTLLNATVTLNGVEVDLSDCEITWTSSNSYASVSGGNVTGNAEGTSVITATLTEVEGKALATPIALKVTVKVQNLGVNSAYLTGNGPITTYVGVAPDYSNINYVIVYEDGSKKIVPASELTFGPCNVSSSGNKVVDIEYNGEKVGTVVVNVIVDFTKLPVADMNDAPEYPNDGAVRIDKTATHNAKEFDRTGVTRVELDVAGISVIQGVDVILVADISNSMAWKAGSKNTSPATGETTKWQDLQAAANGFISVLLGKNEDGTENTNTVSFVIFGGYDADRNAKSSSYTGYFDATATVFTGYSDPQAAQEMINAYSITGTDISGYTVTIDGESAGTPQGGTNYDYAFNEAAAAIAQLKAQYAVENNGANYDDSGREIYILFMTDGAPDHYNQLYYKSRSSSQFDYSALYFNEEDPITADTEYFDSHSVPTYNSFTQHTTNNGYYMPSSGNVSNANWIDWIQSDALYAAELVMAIPRVNSITSVGFDLANGAFSDFEFGESVLNPVLKNLAGPNSCQVFTTNDSAALNQFYVNLAHDIRYAGTDAKVTDIVDQNFSVQMENNVYDNNGNPIALNTPPSITIKTYDLYPRGSVDADGNNITGKRTGTSADIETVTFAMVNGKLQAYSSVIGSRVNILTTDAAGNITISAKYFTYTKDAATSAEKFVWTIGNITDKEIALAFDAYLEGSMQGLRPQDVYYTNEEAILEYVDINGKYAKQIFPIPGVAWGGASTTIRFYLVNEKGEPVNRSGEVIPWENRIYVGNPVVVALNLNADLTIDAQKIEAAAHVPAQFFLYDINAYYTVQTTSSSEAIAGGITVSEPSDDARKTTGTAPNAVTQTGAQTTRVISAEEEYYTWSYVGFGVRWDLSAEPTEYVLTPDQIVIDYGKAIQVDVLANDVTRNEYNRELVGFIKYTAGSDLGYVMENPGSATFSAEYGNFSIVDGKVQFQPTKIINKVQHVFYAVKYTEANNENNFYYVWGQLDVIPATIVYYETNFATDVFTTTGFADVAKTDTTEGKTGGNVTDGPQNDGTIGQNTYGFDTTYNDDAYLSNGSSLFAAGAGVDTTTATFSFTGTGFDLISRTGTAQGLVRVQVFSDAKMTNLVKTVSVLNKSETNLELYQIPVLSIEMDAHGTYYVKIGVYAAYEHNTIPALSRGGEFYFDAIRIYNPAQGNAIAEAAYEADGEANNQINEVRNLLIAAKTFDELNGSTNGVVFVDRTYTEGGIDLGIGNVNVSDYATVGPNNEVYLSKGQAVAFKVKAGSTPASFDVGAKSITGATAGLKVTIRNADGTKSWTVTKEIASSTVQFIDLLKATTGTVDATLFSGEDCYVVITNTGSGVLSITDIKTAFSVSAATAEVDTASVQDTSGISVASVMTTEVADPYSVSFTVDGNTLAVARSVLSPLGKPQQPETPEEPEIPEEPEVDASKYEILDASVKVNGSKKNQKFTITVVTSQEVDNILVFQNSEELTPSKISFKDKKKDGTRTWTIVLTNGVSQRFDSFTLIGVDDSGFQGEALVVSKPH